MHVITKKRIKDTQERFRESASALAGWYKVISQNDFGNFSALKLCFNSVDKVGCYYVFDVGGNKIRIVTSIHFNRKKVYILQVLAHKEYEKGKWKDD